MCYLDQYFYSTGRLACAQSHFFKANDMYADLMPPSDVDDVFPVVMLFRRDEDTMSLGPVVSFVRRPTVDSYIQEGQHILRDTIPTAKLTFRICQGQF